MWLEQTIAWFHRYINTEAAALDRAAFSTLPHILKQMRRLSHPDIRLAVAMLSQPLSSSATYASRQPRPTCTHGTPSLSLSLSSPLHFSAHRTHCIAGSCVRREPLPAYSSPATVVSYDTSAPSTAAKLLSRRARHRRMAEL